ncbi:alpha/beta fold hydrolase [Candidatus Kaiserbacteria bacterium]|nr:alpha/beta fold hydrolase [Candidatus Kaiserbacteria bacterium]
MLSCYVVEITTPKKYLLNGLWFGPKKPKNAIIFIHGLTASAFSMKRMVAALINKDTAVMTFNNRGFEKITEIKRKRGRKTEWVLAGATHEVFAECADDIQGAVNFARRVGAKSIYLAGHSTGCQKAFYWASRKGTRGAKGIILFGPLSDYAIAIEQDRGGKLARSVAYAKKLVHAGKPRTLMPEHLGMWFPCDAQRFLSLHTPDSAEEVFPYGQRNKKPRVLASVSIPTLALLAGNDEHTKKPAKEIATWFKRHLQKGTVVIIPRVKHSFHGGEKQVAAEIRRWINLTE